ncbi:MAG: DUF3892 domain-containing protein [Candidatus Pacearchaeota archaeon]|jgi:hypothetical protein
MARITGRRESKTGGNTHYRIGRRVIPRAMAVKMCKKGKLPGYHVMKVNGKSYLRDNPDSRKKDNIDSQPKI